MEPPVGFEPTTPALQERLVLETGVSRAEGQRACQWGRRKHQNLLEIILLARLGGFVDTEFSKASWQARSPTRSGSLLAPH